MTASQPGAPAPLTEHELAEARALCAVSRPFLWIPEHMTEEQYEAAGRAMELLPAALAEIDRLTKERDEQARLVRRLREIASVAARHLESNRNSRRDNHEAGAAVRRELARYFGETQSKEEVNRG